MREEQTKKSSREKGVHRSKAAYGKAETANGGREKSMARGQVMTGDSGGNAVHKLSGEPEEEKTVPRF